MKPPLENHTRGFQIRLLQYGTREQIIAWLVWNDPNGTYTDRDSEAEKLSRLTIEDARRIMLEQISR